MTVKEKYWNYSLIIIILGLGIALFVEFLPFIGGILGAATIYVMVREQMIRLTEKRRWKRSLAATVITMEVILCFLIPFSLLVWLIYSRIHGVNFDPNDIVHTANNLLNSIYQKIGLRSFEKGSLSISPIISFIPAIAKTIMSSASYFVLDVFVLLFILYFMLVSGPKMEKYIIDILPFNDANKKVMLHKIKILVRSNAIGIPLLAIIQGGVALIGYLVFDVPSPFLFAILTGFASVIPIVGTSLIWFPLVIYLMLIGDWSSAIGLTVYALIIITHIDNLVRFILQKKLADTHPLITVFGVIIGLSLFGFIGIIFGPILLAVFLLCVDMFKKEYLDDK